VAQRVRDLVIHARMCSTRGNKPKELVNREFNAVTSIRQYAVLETRAAELT
jgi:hypothetical protein